MEKYDVVIIGAGPAGLNCAKHLSDTNKKVLILEKNTIIGPKVCAGGLTNKSLDYLKLPKKLIEFRYKDISFKINKFQTKIKNKEVIASTIDRKELGQWQLKKIKNKKNITIKKNTLVTKITKNYVETKKEKIIYEYLIGADGSNSIVRKFLEIKNTKVGIGMQYLIPTKKYTKFAIFFEPKLFSTWYAWIFPHKEYASIGCGVENSKRTTIKQLTKKFHLWLDKNKIDIKEGKYEAFLINSDYQGWKFENIFLAGDAAGLASGFTGEGIYQALVSGEEIAKKIKNKKYESKKMDEIIRVHKQHEKVTLFLSKHKYLVTPVCYLSLLFTRFKKTRTKIINKIA